MTQIETVMRDKLAERQIETALKVARVAYWEYDVAEEVFIFNEQAYHILRTTVEKEGSYVMPAAEYIERFVHPDDAPILINEIRQAFKATDPDYTSDHEYRTIWGDGQPGYLNILFKTEKDENGRVTRLYGTGQDITHRRQIQEQLLLRDSALQAAANAIVITDAGGVIQWVNPAFTRLTGYAAEEVIGQHTRLLKSNVHDQAYYANLWQTVTRGDAWHGEIINRKKNGSLYTEEMTITPIRAYGGEITHHVAIKQDITGRKQAEEALARRAAELETVSRVSAHTATIRDTDKLLQEMVDLTKERFGLYHAHIYLLNSRGDTLLLTAGAGAVGRQMVAEGHSIPLHQEQSLVAQAARTGQGVMENDVRENPVFLPHPLLPDTRSEMAVPMMVGDQVIGVLDVQADEVGRFTQQDIIIQTTLATQAAVALQNANQYQQTQMALSETEALLKITSVASRLLDLETILTEVLDQVLATTGFEIGLISMINPETQLLELAAHRLPEAFYQGILQNGLEGTLCAIVFQRQEPVVLADLTIDSPVDTTGLVAMGYNSYQGVPLEAKGAVLGTLCIFNSDFLSSEEGHIDLLQAVGQQIGFAIRNAALFEQTQTALGEVQQRAAELSIVAQMSMTVAAIQDPAQILQTVGDQTKENFGLYHAHIYLLDESGETLILAAGAGEIGRRIVKEGRRIPLAEKQSLVARAARTRQGVLVNDVAADPGFLPHPLLPDTRSEVAVPMIVGDRVIGVLDVQSDEVDRFTEEDVNIQTTLAAQVAVALENAQSFIQAQEAIEKLNEITRRLTREGWQEYLTDTAAGALGFVYDVSQIDPVLPVAKVKDTLSAGEAAVNDSEGEAIQHFAQSITIHGEPIGRLEVVPEEADESFDPETAEIIAAVTEQLSARIENLRLADQTQAALAEAERQSAELALINRVVTEVSASLHLQESLQIVAKELAQAISVEQVAITLLNESRTEATVVAEYFGQSEYKPALGVVIPVEGNPLTQQVIETRQPVVVTDAQHHPLTAPVHDVMRQRGTQTLAVLPMVAGNEVIGTVGIDILDKDRTFQEEQLRLAETLIFQAATAVQNARLFDQTETALAETETLYQASAELNTADTYEEILQVLRRHTLLSRDAQNVSVNYFERPWTDERRPMWVDVLARISDLPPEATRSRYLLAHFPSAETFLRITEPVVVEDVPNDPRLDDSARDLYSQRFGAKSTIFVPLLVGNQQVGYINAIYQQHTTFPEVERRQLMALARQAAVAVQNLHSFAIAEQRSADLATLNEMGRALTATLDINDILENIHQYTSRLMNTDDLYVALYDQELDEVDIRIFGEGERRIQTALRRRGGNGITEYVIRNRQPLLINEDIEAVADQLGFEIFGRAALSWLGVPVTVGDKVLGVIAVQSFDTPYLYNESHRDLLTALASQVAIAIENVNLFGQARARAQREQLLRQITEKVRSSADMETIMRLALQEVGQALGRNLYIRLGNPEEAPTSDSGNGTSHE